VRTDRAAGNFAMNYRTRPQRQQILELLARLTTLDTRAGRDRLLADLPPALHDCLARSETTPLDLAAILARSAAWPGAAAHSGGLSYTGARAAGTPRKEIDHG
jgi:hypothetical protein